MTERRAWSSHVCTVIRSMLVGAMGALVVGQSTVAYGADATPVRWGGTVTIVSQTPVYVAMSQGYLTEEDIKVQGDALVLSTGPRIREALAAHELDVAEFGAFTYILGRAKGLRQKIFFELFTKEWVSLAVRESLRGKVKSVEDLRGLKIAITSKGSSSHAATLWYLNKVGLKEADVTLIALQSADPAIYVTALESGRVDAAIVWEPIQTLLDDRKSAFELVDLRTQSDHKKWFGDRASSIVIAANEDYLAKNPEVIQRVVRGLKKALTFIATHSEEEVAKVAAPHFKMDPQVFARILKSIKGDFSRDGAVSRSGIAVETDLMRTTGFLEHPLSYEDMVDARFTGSAP